MIKNTIVILMASVILIGSASVVSSQMIDYERIKKRSKVKRQLINTNVQTVGPAKVKNSNVQKVETTAKPAQQSVTVKTQAIKHKSFQEMIVSQPPVKDRIERIYDLNRDGLLQENEIIDMYRDVILSANRKGSFLVGSDLLKEFDINEDGRISRAEASTLDEKIN